MFSWKQKKTFSDLATVTQEEWSSSIEKIKKFTQHNYENGLLVTQKEVIRWIVHLETMENVTGTLLDSHVRESKDLLLKVHL